MIFIDNKYTKCYFNIIEKAKSRSPNSNTLYEKHHIIPKSLGGSNKKENLASLTLREHFICHLLLPEMTDGMHRQKMIFAIRRMSTIKNKYKISSRLYDRIKSECIQILKNTKQSEESNRKRSLTQSGKSYETLFGKEKADELKSLRSICRKGGYGRQNTS